MLTKSIRLNIPMMAKFRISGVPITRGRKLVGIITNRDLKFEEDFTKKIADCMTSEEPNYSVDE